MREGSLLRREGDIPWQGLAQVLPEVQQMQEESYTRFTCRTRGNTLL